MKKETTEREAFSIVGSVSLLNKTSNDTIINRNACSIFSIHNEISYVLIANSIILSKLETLEFSWLIKYSNNDITRFLLSLLMTPVSKLRE